MLGYAAAERDRLARQAALLAPLTERFFREAGIGNAHRVLEIGSGIGDVTQIVARLVGAAGKVVGVEQDAPSIARARARIDAAGLGHVAFVQTDGHALELEETFDAVVGRFVLNHIRVRTPVHVAEQCGVSSAALGDLDTLVERIQGEALNTCAPIGFTGVVSGWSTVS